jgi:ketosteroid isomerase-like protein
MRRRWLVCEVGGIWRSLSLSPPATIPAPHNAAMPTSGSCRVETAANHAHLSGDAEALDHLWADDVEVAVPHMAVMTRAGVLGFARSGHMKFLRYETSDLHIRVYGDAVVVTGHLLRTRTLNGNNVSDDWHFTKVYIRQAHQWRVVSFQASDSPTP